jgi:hypothetical protein
MSLGGKNHIHWFVYYRVFFISTLVWSVCIVGMTNVYFLECEIKMNATYFIWFTFFFLFSTQMNSRHVFCACGFASTDEPWKECNIEMRALKRPYSTSFFFFSRILSFSSCFFHYFSPVSIILNCVFPSSVCLSSFFFFSPFFRLHFEYYTFPIAYIFLISYNYELIDRYFLKESILSFFFSKVKSNWISFFFIEFFFYILK